MTTDKKLLVQEGLDAFWDVIAQKFPEAKTGDLSPLTTLQLDQAAETAIHEWIESNVPKPQNTPAHTPGPWFVDRQSRYSALCIKPYPGRIVCDIDGTDVEAEANAMLIAAAPELRRESQSLYDAIQYYLIGVPDSELPEELVAAFDALEAAWHKADGTEPEVNDKTAA